MNDPRVVITGFGLLSPFGRTVEEFGDALFAGKSAICELEGWPIEDKRFSLGGQLKEFDIREEMPEADCRRMYRYAHFSLVATKRVFADAGVSLSTARLDRIGCAFSTSAAGLADTVDVDVRRFIRKGDRGISPTAWMEYTASACSTNVAIHFGLRGPSTTYSSGCTGSVDTATWGLQQIRAGKADMMIVGGTDAPFTPFVWGGFCRSGILAPYPDDGGMVPRPFSKDHNGIAVSEGASALMLETEAHARLRGARIYAEVLGVANMEEALPMHNIDATGEAFAITMQQTLHDAGMPVTAVDGVFAHGTGHPIADSSESLGIETALGRHAFSIPVSAVRSALGQSMGGGGAQQMAAACLALQRQMMPPTINFSEPAEDCRLDYVPNVARTSRLRRLLINTAGVGGTHAGILLGAYEG